MLVLVIGCPSSQSRCCWCRNENSFTSTNSHKTNFHEFTLIQNELQSAIEWANNVRRASQRSHTHRHETAHWFFSFRMLCTILLNLFTLFQIYFSIFYCCGSLFFWYFLFYSSFFRFFSHRSSLYSSGVQYYYFFTIILLADRKLCFLPNTSLKQRTNTHTRAQNVNHEFALRFSYGFLAVWTSFCVE